MDSPVVWLPRAVTTALGDAWPDVQEAACHALRLAMDAEFHERHTSPFVGVEKMLRGPSFGHMDTIAVAMFE